MIFRRRYRNTDVPGLNTASLPDLIFTVLFFFMIVTNMRHDDVLVRYVEPDGTQLSKFKTRNLATNIYIGRKIIADEKVAGLQQQADSFLVQVDSRIMAPASITSYIIKKKQNVEPADWKKMVVNIRADKDAPMSLIREVKESLKKADALLVHYSANEKD